jgi:Trk K+ transport system NAD-binding subunit
MFRERSFARDTFGSGEVEMMEFELPSNLVGRRVGDFEVPGEVHVAAIERLGAALLPVAGTSFEQGDTVSVLVLRQAMDKYKKMFFLT